MIKYIPATIYPYELYVILGESDKKVESFIKKNFKGSKKEKEEIIEAMSLETCRGLYYFSRRGVSIIRVDKEDAYSIIQHELLHFVFKIFKRIGIKLSYKSEEAFSYYLEYLTREIYKK